MLVCQVFTLFLVFFWGEPLRSATSWLRSRRAIRSITFAAARLGGSATIPLAAKNDDFSYLMYSLKLNVFHIDKTKARPSYLSDALLFFRYGRNLLTAVMSSCSLRYKNLKILSQMKTKIKDTRIPAPRPAHNIIS
jgi:hypothetical protein